MQHMASSHANDWPQTVHDQPVWTCSERHEFNVPYMFSTQGELDNHCRLLHVRDGAAGNSTATPEARSRPPNAYPLCLYAVSDPNEEEKLAEEGALPKLELMAKHVASRLEAIALLTLSIMSAASDINEDEGSERSVFSNESKPDAKFVQPSLQDSGDSDSEASTIALSSRAATSVNSEVVAWEDLSIPPPEEARRRRRTSGRPHATGEIRGAARKGHFSRRY